MPSVLPLDRLGLEQRNPVNAREHEPKYKETADVELGPGLASVRSVPIAGSGSGLALVLIEARSLVRLPPSVPDPWSVPTSRINS